MLELVVNNKETPQLHDPILIYRTHNIVDVLFAKILLQSNHIPYRTANEMMFQVFPGVVPVEFYVAEQQAEEAQSIFEEYEEHRRIQRTHLQPV